MSMLSPTDAHVMPAQDDPQHETTGTCWCQPVVNYEAPAGGRVFVHRRHFDGPVYEHDSELPDELCPYPTGECAEHGGLTA